MPARSIFEGDIPKEDFVSQAKGPFRAVKRQPFRNVELGPVLAKIKAVNQGVPNFCQFQPQIEKFAWSNPDNMAATIIFVFASQGTTWHNLRVWFPMMLQHVRSTGGLYPYPDNVPWKAMVYRGGSDIDSAWKNRRVIMQKLEKTRGDPLEVFAVLLTLPGLSLPKAGFAAQLISGKFGCVDSVNAAIFGVPLDLMVVDQENQPSFQSMKPFVKNGALTATGRSKLELYVQFLDSIKLVVSDSASQQLWDSWCEIVAGKIWHASSPRGQLDVQIGKHKTKVATYPDHLATAGYHNPAPESPGANLSKERDLLGQVEPDKRGPLVGRQHREIITGESLAEQLVAALLS